MYLVGIVSQDPVYHDGLFTSVKPAVFAAEPAGGLARRWGKIEPRNDANDGSQAALEDKQPSPTCPAGDTAHVEDTIGEEGGNDVCRDVRAPEAGKADRQLLRLVEIREVQNDIGNKATFDQAQ